VRVRDIEKSQRFTTTTVALVTSFYKGKENVMSAEWSIRASIDPFLIAVFVSYERETYEMIRGSGEFGVSYCSQEQAGLAHIAGNYSLKDTDKFSIAKFPLFYGHSIRAPLVDGAISNFECSVENEIQAGDHAIFIGRVLDGYYDNTKKPLIYHQGKFFMMGDRISHINAERP